MMLLLMILNLIPHARALTEAELQKTGASRLRTFLAKGETLRFEGEHRVVLHGIRFVPPSPRGRIVFLAGFSEPWMKYLELLLDLHEAGYEVLSYDHRGQGSSPRLSKHALDAVHVEDFEHYRADLDRFTQSFVKPKSGRTFLLAHSMGGAIALSALDSGSAGPYEKFVLNAPMLAMKTSPFPRWLARGLVDVLSGLGFGDSYAPTRGPRQALPEFQGAKGTSSPVRFALTRTLEIEQPGLFVGGPTNAWVRNALQASSTIARGNRAPRKPLLFLVPTDDAFAEPGELLSLCRSGIPGCSALELPGSKHEVFVERDEYRDRALRVIYEFLER